MSFQSLSSEVSIVALVAMTLLVAGIGYLVWLKLSNNATGFAVTFAKLPQSAQSAITELFAAQNLINFSLNATAKNMLVTQVNSSTDAIGISFATPDNATTVYISYYEYLNWYGITGATLYVPARTVAAGVATDSTTNGFSLTFNTTTLTIAITAISGSTKSRITYADANGANIIIPTDSLSMTTNVSTQTSYAEFTNKTSLNPIAANILTSKQATIGALTYSYNGGTKTTPAPTSTTLTASEFLLSGTPAGYLITSADGTKNVYLTYYEMLHLVMTPASPITVPLRSSSGTAITDSFSSGFSVYLSGSAVTIYPYANALTEAMLAPANVVDIYGQGIGYPFYVTYDMVGLVGQGFVSTFLDRQFMLQYKFGGSTVSVSASHLILNNVQSGIQLVFTPPSGPALTIYLSYSQLINWMLKDLVSAGSDASITVQAYGVGNGTAADGSGAIVQILTPVTGSFTLAFDSANNAQINLSQSTVAVAAGFAPTITFKSATGVSTTVNANTGS